MLGKMSVSSLRNLVKFLEITGTLKRTQRSGWVDVGISQPESIADHTFRTAFLCMLYADMEGLDPLKMLRMALIHDLAEAVIGDLMPSQKTKESKEDEETAMHNILALLPEMQSENYLDVWDEYQRGETIEAMTSGDTSSFKRFQVRKLSIKYAVIVGVMSSFASVYRWMAPKEM